MADCPLDAGGIAAVVIVPLLVTNAISIGVTWYLVKKRYSTASSQSGNENPVYDDPPDATYPIQENFNSNGALASYPHVQARYGSPLQTNNEVTDGADIYDDVAVDESNTSPNSPQSSKTPKRSPNEEEKHSSYVNLQPLSAEDETYITFEGSKEAAASGNEDAEDYEPMTCEANYAHNESTTEQAFDAKQHSVAVEPPQSPASRNRPAIKPKPRIAEPKPHRMSSDALHEQA